MRLNGWQRLWVIVSAIYSVLIILVALTLHNGEIRVLVEEVLPSLKEDVRVLIAAKGRLKERSSDVAQSESIDWLEETLKQDEEPVDYFELPDGTSLSFVSGTPDNEQKRAAAEYWEVAQSIQVSKRSLFISKVTALWIIPCITLYVLGWVIGWVYRGFK